MRRVKIIATIGPSTSSAESIGELIEDGMDVARLNFSHGDHIFHAAAIERVHSASEESSKPVAILQDLSGIKIRTGPLQNGEPVELVEGQPFTITTEEVTGNRERVSTSYQELTADVQPNDRILLSDGLIELQALVVRTSEIECRVVTGGTLMERQGIHLPGTTISGPPLTEKDIVDLEFGLSREVDFVAQSFVRCSQDVSTLKAQIARLGAQTPVIAKIEKPVAVDRLDEILEVADGIMVARGDLGVEISPERVPVVQKKAVQKAVKANKLVIIATQMLDSMMFRPLPSRAEASDVANAVFDGADALMLSGETAVGRYPHRAVRMMGRIIEQAEKVTSEFRRDVFEPLGPEVPHAICDAAYHAAKTVQARVITAFTQSGFTAKLMSSYRPDTNIVGCTPDLTIARQMSLFWGVRPMLMGEIPNVDELIIELEKLLTETKLAFQEDKIVIISGAPIIEKGSTNLMKLHEIRTATD